MTVHLALTRRVSGEAVAASQTTSTRSCITHCRQNPCHQQPTTDALGADNDVEDPYVQYIAVHAPKLKVLAGMVREITNGQGRKVLLFADWPLTQWCVEMFLHTCGFNVIGIRAQNKQTERDECVRAFCDPDSNVQVLVTSMRISATAIYTNTPWSGIARSWRRHNASGIRTNLYIR